MRAREPDREGFVEREGVRISYEVFGDGPDDHGPAAPDLVDHALAHVEGAGPVPRATFPCRHVRRPGQRPLGSASSRRAYTASRVRRRHAGGAGSDRHRPGGAGRPLLRHALEPARRGRPPGAGTGHRRHRARRPARTARRPNATVDSFDEPLDHARGLGQVQPRPLAGRRLRRLPAVLLRPDVHRAALHQADRGRVGWAPDIDAGDAGRQPPTACSTRAAARACRAGLPRACGARYW